MKTKTFQDMVASAPETMCLYPFTHVNFKFAGKASCCFRSKFHLSMKTRGSTDLWASSEFNRIRADLASGVKVDECRACWDLEKNGGFSYRQESLRSLTIHEEWRDSAENFDLESKTMNAGPRQVEIRLSNLCSLTCRMCSPDYSSKWAGLLQKNPRLQEWFDQKASFGSTSTATARSLQKFPEHENQILAFIDKYKSSLKYVMFAGGEPLMQRTHYETLKRLHPHEKDITLEYTSNLNVLKDKEENSVLDFWAHFKRVRVKISLDADDQLYPYIRVGGNMANVLQNLQILQERFPSENRLEERTGFPHDQLVLIGTCTVSAYNIARLPEIARFFTRHGLIFHTSQVQIPAFYSSQVLPYAVKLKIKADLERFLDRLPQELSECWDGQKLWNVEKVRHTQMSRITKFVRNSISYMLSTDQSVLFKDLREYESIYAEATKTKELLEIYPEWGAHV